VLHSGMITEPGIAFPYQFDARCGVEWLGQLNGIWWRTDDPAGVRRSIPDAWQGAIAPSGLLEVQVILRTADDPAVTDGRPRVEATAGEHTLRYGATTEPDPGC
jgi:hypothetical protein